LPKRSDIPIEERHYGHIYFILSALLAISTFWVIWDMIRTRAPWQRYQMELNQTEVELIEEELSFAEENFEVASLEEYEATEAELEIAKEQLAGESYLQVLSELKQAEQEIVNTMQNYRFAKSEYDAIWYQFKHAEHAAMAEEAAAIRPKVDKMNLEVDRLKRSWDEAEGKKTEIERRMTKHEAEATRLEAKLVELKKPMTDLMDRLDRIGDRKIAIEQFVLTDFVQGNFGSFLDVVDRCTSCHANIDQRGYEDWEIPFETHPNQTELLKTHPINKFGCTPCHEGQGEALRIPHAHGQVEFWEYKLLNRDFLESGCNKCHNAEFKVEGAAALSKAKRMVYDLGCYGCHDIAGYEDARKIGPSLNAVTSKTTPEFIYRWVRDTKSFRQFSRMPNPMFTDDEAKAVTSYLVDLGEKTDYIAPKASVGGSVKRGEELVETLGCKGCHVITDEDREVRVVDVTHDIAPELIKIGSKVSRDWLYDWIREPKRYNPETTMPDLRLTDREAKDVVAYLMSNKETNPPANGLVGIELSDATLIDEGKKIVRNFGCHGCHKIDGMEKEGKVSVSLNEFGGKTHDELFFGDAHANGQVQHETWNDWTIGKMKNSRLYETEAVIQRMPNFQFSESDAIMISMLLRSWDGRVFGEKYIRDSGLLGESLEKGRRLVRKYNCTGCHIIEGDGGFIRPSIVAAFGRRDRGADEAISSSPPNLIGEGRKVQPDWLFEFLNDPTTQIRPWLNVRMPTFNFTDQEVNDLIKYFQALEGMSEAFSEINIELTAAELRAAESMFQPDLLNCFGCHQVGSKKPEGPPTGWAPDFFLAADRLNPDWVYDWIANPQELQPDTKMPSFYPDAAPQDILGGDPDRQIEALRDYLMNIRRVTSQ